jgi:hypothetical protein
VGKAVCECRAEDGRIIYMAPADCRVAEVAVEREGQGEGLVRRGAPLLSTPREKTSVWWHDVSEEWVCECWTEEGSLIILPTDDGCWDAVRQIELGHKSKARCKKKKY